MTPDKPPARVLEGIYIGSGISSKTGAPFCHVTVQAADGQFCEGQLDPETARRMAHDWVEAAEASIHDAAVYDLLTGQGMPERDAAAFIVALREHRRDAGRMVDAPE